MSLDLVWVPLKTGFKEHWPFSGGGIGGPTLTDPPATASDQSSDLWPNQPTNPTHPQFQNQFLRRARDPLPTCHPWAMVSPAIPGSPGRLWDKAEHTERFRLLSDHSRDPLRLSSDRQLWGLLGGVGESAYDTWRPWILIGQVFLNFHIGLSR